jgi:glucokinase
MPSVWQFGYIDNKTRRDHQSPTGGWRTSLRDIISEKFGIVPSIENDASMAAYGEWKHGAGRGHNYLLYMTISTGVGGAVIDDGHLLTGFRGLGTEKGHMTIVENGPLCSCGQPGHLEALASGTGISA